MTLLRLLLIVVILANVAYAVWARGGLALFDLQPASLAQREPQRLGLQVRPEVIQLRPTQAQTPPPPAAASQNTP